MAGFLARLFQSTTKPPRVKKIVGSQFPVASLGFRNIKDEAAFLRRLVDGATKSLPLKEQALAIVRDCGVPSRDEEGQAIAIGRWVQENIYYVHEGIEFFQKPSTTLRLRAGDCDDFTVLICSMLATLGIPSKLVLMKINGKWAHIFPVAIVRLAGTGFHRIPLDATLRKEKYPIDKLQSPVTMAQKRGDKVELLEV